MRDKKQVETARPPATAARVRALHDKAAEHAARAEQHRSNAASIEADGNARAEQILQAAEASTAEVMQKAKEMASQILANAEARIAEDRRQAHAAADQERRETGLRAQPEKDRYAEQEREREYWTALGDAEAASLPPVAETLTDGALDVSRVDGQEVGS